MKFLIIFNKGHSKAITLAFSEGKQLCTGLGSPAASLKVNNSIPTFTGSYFCCVLGQDTLLPLPLIYNSVELCERGRKVKTLNPVTKDNIRTVIDNETLLREQQGSGYLCKCQKLFHIFKGANHIFIKIPTKCDSQQEITRAAQYVPKLL